MAASLVAKTADLPHTIRVPQDSVAEQLTAALADRYRIEHALGQGGMATVYLAEDLTHGRQVAEKVWQPELAAVVGADRFVQEIETTAGLRHTSVLPLYDSGEAAGLLYYVMPLVEGESLRDRLEREGTVPVDESLRLAAGRSGSRSARIHASGESWPRPGSCLAQVHHDGRREA